MNPGLHRSHKRTLLEFGHYLGCYFMDERAAVTALLQNARLLGQSGQGLAGGNDNIVTGTRQSLRAVLCAQRQGATPETRLAEPIAQPDFSTRCVRDAH